MLRGPPNKFGNSFIFPNLSALTPDFRELASRDAKRFLFTVSDRSNAISDELGNKVIAGILQRLESRTTSRAPQSYRPQISRRPAVKTSFGTLLSHCLGDQRRKRNS